MARKPRSANGAPKRAPTPPPPAAGTDREKIIAAFLALLAEKPFEQIGFGDIAKHAGVTLAVARGEFGSTLAVLAAHAKALDRRVLAGGDADMADEPPRERLFDVLMRRIEAMAPYREATRSLLHSARRNPGLAFALNGLALRSQRWMLTAADIDAAGPRGLIRAQGLAMLFASVLRTWVDDEDEGLARTMAALDRALGRGQRWSGMLEDLCRFAPTRCLRRRRHRRRDEYEEEEPAAA
ncbi:MAG TPA: TetR/AcrR family transcriptional regulator [Xanthobacteraceae bacterium]|nr:TetR/AcrR family transcriptional regulator [Xanthobacteraceae bacterium]